MFSVSIFYIVNRIFVVTPMLKKYSGFAVPIIKLVFLCSRVVFISIDDILRISLHAMITTLFEFRMNVYPTTYATPPYTLTDFEPNYHSISIFRQPASNTQFRYCHP